jgi:hypothetical protein
MGKKTCFVIGPIGSPDSDDRKRADALLKHIVKKVLEAAPFEMMVTRADDMGPGLITQQILEQVINADLVIADLTNRNGNALYELAVRHVTKKPVVHMILTGQTLPFDIGHQRAISFDTENLDAAEQAKEDLKKHVDAVLKDPQSAYNPITLAKLVLDLARGTTTTDKALALILREITELRKEIGRAPSANLGFGDLGFGGTPVFRGTIYPQTGLFNEYMRTGQEPLRSVIEAISRKVDAIAADRPAPAPTYANCGQPIAGRVGRRSADNAPIHWEGQCPPVAPPTTATPST